MTILDRAAQLVNGAAAHERERGYTFLRAECATPVLAGTWLRDWIGPDGERPWLGAAIGAASREGLAKRWIFLRFWFRAAIREREAWGAERRIWGDGDGR